MFIDVPPLRRKARPEAVEVASCLQPQIGTARIGEGIEHMMMSRLIKQPMVSLADAMDPECMVSMWKKPTLAICSWWCIS